MKPCVICDREDWSFRWTDFHGIGTCTRCGAPYKLYHYEGEGKGAKRVDKPPELMIIESWIPVLRHYWQETHRNVDPGAYNFPGSSYEVATREDVDSLNEWLKAHEDEIPKKEEDA